MAFYDGEFINENGNTVALYLLELCEGGTLFDLMEKYEKTKLSEKQIIYIISEIAE